MNNPLQRMKIGTSLLLIVLVMMVLMLATSYLIFAHYDSAIIGEIQDQTESLSKALQISVQQLTSQETTSDSLLRDYVERLSSKGVREISILSNEKEVVASSNQAKVGKKLPPAKRAMRKGDFVISGTLGDEEALDGGGKISEELDIPIVVNNEKRGYVRLHLLLDDLDALIRAAHTRRLVATCAVFLTGMAGIIALAYRTTRDLNGMAGAASRVAEGDLSVRVETRREDEVGRLIGTFNQMVEKLGEQRALESRLRKAERTLAIGKLAAAVAHEIRNPLNLISLSIGHLRTEFCPPDEPGREEFTKIVDSVRDELNRLNRMVSDFLAYGRPRRLSLRPCRIEEILEDVLSLTSPKALEQRIDVDKRLAVGLPVVQADPEGLRACFLNVVMNAIQAMPAGGRLTIECAAEHGPDGGPVVSVYFKDTGPGIALADIERIFEPYFSTREAGVGLGLAITQRIIQEHGGAVHVECLPGAGAAFRLDIPVRAVTEPAAEAAWERA